MVNSLNVSSLPIHHSPFTIAYCPLPVAHSHFNPSLSSYLLYLISNQFMKKILLFSSVLIALCGSVQAQGFKSILKNATKTDSTGKTTVGKIFEKAAGQKGGLTNDEIISGLKEALQVGA